MQRASAREVSHMERASSSDGADAVPNPSLAPKRKGTEQIRQQGNGKASEMAPGNLI